MNTVFKTTHGMMIGENQVKVSCFPSVRADPHTNGQLRVDAVLLFSIGQKRTQDNRYKQTMEKDRQTLKKTGNS